MKAAVPLVLLAAVVLCASSAGAQQASFGRNTTITAPKGWRFDGALTGDIDGDGRTDLIVVAGRAGKRSRRTARVHLGRAGETAFEAEPSREIDLLPDVTAIAVGDVHADPGDELVVFGAAGAFAVRTAVESERDRYARLLDADFLWQLPHERKVVVWEEGVVDVDGDGLDDLLVPTGDGYVIGRQSRAAGGVASFRSSLLSLPDAGALPMTRGARRARGRAERRRLTIEIGVGSVASDLLNVQESVPAPQLRDWNGDGRVDLLAQTAEALHVWLQQNGGVFDSEPSHSFDLPLEVNRRRLLDVSYAALADDLDGDGRADYVLAAGDDREDEDRAQVLVYRRRGSDVTASPFGDGVTPSQVLIIAGIAGPPRLDDVDGDGRKDLVVGALRLDALDAIRAVGGGSLGAGVYVFLNKGAAFSRSPDLTTEVDVSAKGLRNARRSLTARFIGDVTGDGISELLVRDDPEHVALKLVRKGRDGSLSVLDRNVYETRVDDRAELSLLEGAGGHPELVVLSDREILHVRFR